MGIEMTEGDLTANFDAFPQVSLDESPGYYDADSNWAFDEGLSMWDTAIPRTAASYTTTPHDFEQFLWIDNDIDSLSPASEWDTTGSSIGAWTGSVSGQGSSNFQIDSPNSLIFSGNLDFPDPSNSAVAISACRDSSLPSSYYCEWPDCGVSCRIEDSKSHLKYHARAIREQWQPLGKCSWYKCRSKARHKTVKQLEDHVNNIHINPLICTFEGCKHKTPFRGKADLYRHIQSVHKEGSKAQCPYIGCSDRLDGKDFSRKDKLVSHLREHHDTDPCPYVHCFEILDPERDSTARHISKAHGEFECGMSSCSRSTSQFSESGLLEHLQLDHGMQWDLVLKTRDFVKCVGSKIVRVEHVAVGQAVSACKNIHCGNSLEFGRHIVGNISMVGE